MRRMEGVRHALQATVNLFSFDALTSMGYEVLLTEKQCTVGVSKTKEVIANGLEDEFILIRKFFRCTSRGETIHVWS